jgi:multisubunit Na+/H+ antiporter MnhG subunit
LTVTGKKGSLRAMQLIWFHRVLIGAAIVFFAGFGVWELLGYNSNRDSTALVLGLVSIVVAVALLIYLLRLKRILKLPE